MKKLMVLLLGMFVSLSASAALQYEFFAGGGEAREVTLTLEVLKNTNGWEVGYFLFDNPTFIGNAEYHAFDSSGVANVNTDKNIGIYVSNGNVSVSSTGVDWTFSLINGQVMDYYTSGNYMDIGSHPWYLFGSSAFEGNVTLSYPAAKKDDVAPSGQPLPGVLSTLFFAGAGLLLFKRKKNGIS